MRIRWCCAELKESAGAGKVTLIGIRKSESSRRAKRHEVEVSNKKFSGNLEQFAKWQQEEIAKKEEKLMRKMKREGKKVNEDEFSLQQDNEVRCINGKDSILVSPIFEWSESDVWYFLNDVLGVPHCELYDQGYTRIGCIMCPMSQYKHKLREMKDFPHVKRGWIRAIKQIRAGVGITNQTYCKPINYPPTTADCGRVHLVEHPRTRDEQERQRDAQKLGAEQSSEVGTERNVSATGSGSGTTGGSFHTHTHTSGRSERRGGLPTRTARLGTWNRKTNTGLWAGFLKTPLLTAQ